MLTIYDTLSGEKRAFKPRVPNKVSLYVCGMTVYDYCHIGHARSMIVFDMVVRYLKLRGYQVNFVRNITDIDDKIIKRANENGESSSELTDRFIAAMHEDEKALHLNAPDHEPRATEYVQEIIAFIEALIEQDIAYVAGNGDVCFEISKFKEYGKLARRDLDKLKSGVRVDMAEGKKDPLDFVLWKLAKPGEPKWPSPWGDGRPGWHIECSAMSSTLLGQPFDIHGGGMDLKFPHHENEIAQSEACFHKPFANNWMHVGLLNVNDEKMSKSLNNFFTIREVLAEYHAEVVRYFMMAAHYRSPVNFSKPNLAQAAQALNGLYTALRGLALAPVTGAISAENKYVAQFFEAMDDDFNTAIALSVLFDLAHEINRLKSAGDFDQAAQCGQFLKELGYVLGVLQEDPEDFLRGGAAEDFIGKVELLISSRNTARSEKNWQEADRIRDELLQLGVLIEDSASGTTWRRA